MNTRRHFLRTSTNSILLAICSTHTNIHESVTGSNPKPRGGGILNRSWRMPDENATHDRTWMAFGASQKIWGRKLIGEVRKNLATIAQTIAKFEPVVMCVRPEQTELAKSFFETLDNIEFMTCELNDLWIRDYGAVYVVNESGNKAAVNFNFNGWGEKQESKKDARIAKQMAEYSNVQFIDAEICLEGGGIEIDGNGTAIITESCVLNRNRNPDWTKNDCEKELNELLGISKTIWLPGVRGADITDGHTDFYARFASPGVVLVHVDQDPSSPDHGLTRRHIEILENSTDANGQTLKIVTLESPARVRRRFDNNEFCAGYVNFYVCNDAVIGPQFGDTRMDAINREKLQQCYPDREIILLNIDGIAAGGGGIHCATQQEPSAES
ncbi:MAG: agmatine deiminase family protein [Planctomycetota bacterium]